MQSDYSHILSKIGLHLEHQISKIHSSYKGENKFLNNLFVSPGDFYYGVFNTSHTDKAISKFSKLLGAEGFEVIFTDLEFDANLKLLYCFDIRFDEMTVFSVKYDYSTKSFSKITCEDYDAAEWMLRELAEGIENYE